MLRLNLFFVAIVLPAVSFAVEIRGIGHILSVQSEGTGKCTVSVTGGVRPGDVLYVYEPQFANDALKGNTGPARAAELIVVLSSGRRAVCFGREQSKGLHLVKTGYLVATPGRKYPGFGQGPDAYELEQQRRAEANAHQAARNRNSGSGYGKKSDSPTNRGPKYTWDDMLKGLGATFGKNRVGDALSEVIKEKITDDPTAVDFIKNACMDDSLSEVAVDTAKDRLIAKIGERYPKSAKTAGFLYDWIMETNKARHERLRAEK